MKCSRIGLAGCLSWTLKAHAAFNAFLWDNDVFSPRATDAYYSNGFIFHSISDPVPPERGRQWHACPGLDWLSHAFRSRLIPVDSDSGFWHSWEVGQIIQTPLDKKARPPDPLDQPYAGLLYAGCNYHVHTLDRAESLGLQFGLVGPWSLAEQSQHLVHKLVGANEARGWNDQLRNEVVINIRYDRQEVIGETELWDRGLSVFDNMDITLGPLLTSATAGINVLFAHHSDLIVGVNPNYLGRYPRIISGQPLGFYTMGTLQVTGVLRNLFLDGNTWAESPARVDHEPVLGSAQWLIGYGFSCWALQLGLNVSTRTFRTQDIEWPRYGSLVVSWDCR